jgi:type 1 fimbriae regulatory protein FimB
MGKPKCARKEFYKHEVEALLEAALKHPQPYNRIKYYCLIKIAYRHGLRATEVANLKWEDLDLEDNRFLVKRAKNGTVRTHYLSDDLVEDLKTLQFASRFYTNAKEYVFLNLYYKPYKKNPARLNIFLKYLAREAGLNIVPHFHMFRHGCGYYLNNVKNVNLRVIQEYLGHRDINSTVLYTRVDDERLKGLMD